MTSDTGVPNGKSVVDNCGVCGGDSSSCAGCDGVPGSNAVSVFACLLRSHFLPAAISRSFFRFDACEVCAGSNDTCALILIIMDSASGLAISVPLLALAAFYLILMGW